MFFYGKNNNLTNEMVQLLALDLGVF